MPALVLKALHVYSEIIFDWIKKIICLKHFLWCKEIFCFNETKFVWFIQNIFGANKYLFESNFCLKSNKSHLWPYINASISLFWRKINLIQTNIYLDQRNQIFDLFKQIIFIDSFKSFLHSHHGWEGTGFMWKITSKISSNLYVLRPPESEKTVFTKVSVCLSDWIELWHTLLEP